MSTFLACNLLVPADFQMTLQHFHSGQHATSLTFIWAPDIHTFANVFQCNVPNLGTCKWNPAFSTLVQSLDTLVANNVSILALVNGAH